MELYDQFRITLDDMNQNTWAKGGGRARPPGNAMTEKLLTRGMIFNAEMVGAAERQEDADPANHQAAARGNIKRKFIR